MQAFTRKRRGREGGGRQRGKGKGGRSESGIVGGREEERNRETTNASLVCCITSRTHRRKYVFLKTNKHEYTCASQRSRKKTSIQKNVNNKT